MGDTNYFSGIVKVLETPMNTSLNNNNLVTTFRVEIPQFRKNKIILLTFWGNLVREVKSYYQINDYILIEGYIAIQNKKRTSLITKIPKQVKITVLKVSPILLQGDRSL